MPRGRHRHSPPLHRVLQPSAVAGVSLLLAVGAWLFADPVVLRCLVAAAAATAVAGAVLMRSWDRVAGRRVADLIRARTSDEWKAEEQLAELEGDLEESRALRAKLESKLRSKRIELAALRGEHAGLLRRYATAETERASALEGRRLLAIEAAAPPRAALPAASSRLTPSVYARAAQALDALPRNAAFQREQRERQQQQEKLEQLKQARQKQADRKNAQQQADRNQDHRNQPQAPQEAAEPEGKPGKPEAAVGEHTRPSSALPVPRNVPATAVVPYTAQQARARRPEGRFDFFGMQKAAAAPVRARLEPAQLESVQHEDLADVVGAEAIEAHKAAAALEAEAEAARTNAAAHEAGEVIDLTAHDETEQIDVAGLRSAIS
ncbi:hypothetical protein AB0436_26745 [Streptomyces sp. NPDC051322]|uniref:hypothetical protein n=1 Tax=Streptomyces sp. NPDC051322 TaxID=3154645 RepID=UPI00344C6B7A